MILEVFLESESEGTEHLLVRTPFSTERTAFVSTRYRGTESALNDNQTRATFKDREPT